MAMQEDCTPLVKHLHRQRNTMISEPSKINFDPLIGHLSTYLKYFPLVLNARQIEFKSPDLCLEAVCLQTNIHCISVYVWLVPDKVRQG